MRRARRLAATAVAAALAVTGLAACQSSPEVAAYVGREKIPQRRVDSVFADAKGKLAASVEQVRAQQGGASPAPEKVELQISKQDVLATLVGLDVFRRIAQERGVQAVAQDSAQVAQTVSLPANTEFVRLYAEYRGLVDAFTKAAKPSVVTETDLRDVYERLKASGGLGAEGGTFEQFQQGLNQQNSQLLQQNVSVRNDLAPDVRKYHTRVNPRYNAIEVGLVNFRNPEGKTVPLVLLSLSTPSASPAVSDLP
jgi:hypothetical protein